MNKNYSRYLKTKKWKRFRKKVFRYKGRVCKKCGRKATQVAHKNYKNLFREKLKDVEPSCPYCNKEEYLKRKC